MKSNNSSKKQPPTNAHDFRHVPADSVNIGVGDNGVKLVFGVEDSPGRHVNLVAVHMSHRIAASLRDALAGGIEHYENVSGTKVEAIAAVAHDD